MNQHYSNFKSEEEIEREVARQFEIISANTIEITPKHEFLEMLKQSIKEQKKLRVKCGIDPTVSDIHIGHLVPYRKMRQFQDLGHIGVVVIGDYTAQIGDPTGKVESRPSLDFQTVRENAKRYMDQVFTVLDREKTEIRFQSEWFQERSLEDILKWASEVTVAKLLSHETFRDRLEKGNPLGLHELFYPVLQGIDSVYIDADIELGGSDQKFNVLMGRDFQRNRDTRPQVAILLPLLTGLCGKEKMSKSLGNYIPVFNEPFDLFGKIMSIPDNLMEEYYKYAPQTKFKDISQIIKNIQSGELHPNDAKKQLASAIVAFFHGGEVGDAMRLQFEDVFKKNKAPDDILEWKISTKSETQNLQTILVESGILESNSEVKRMLKQNAISFLEGEKITDPFFKIDHTFNGKIIKVGKRKFLKIVSE